MKWTHALFGLVVPCGLAVAPPAHAATPPNAQLTLNWGVGYARLAQNQVLIAAREASSYWGSLNRTGLYGGDTAAARKRFDRATELYFELQDAASTLMNTGYLQLGSVANADQLQAALFTLSALQERIVLNESALQSLGSTGLLATKKPILLTSSDLTGASGGSAVEGRVMSDGSVIAAGVEAADGSVGVVAVYKDGSANDLMVSRPGTTSTTVRTSSCNSCGMLGATVIVIPPGTPGTVGDLLGANDNVGFSSGWRAPTLSEMP